MSIAKDGNTLIVGAPGVGKTTLLRDVAVNVANKSNVVVVDERGELDVQDVLCDCDLLKWTSKSAGFEMALRCLSPDFIVCDELALEDVSWLSKVFSSGVKVVATLHGNVCNLHLQSNILQYFDSVIVCQSVGSYQIVKTSNFI